MKITQKNLFFIFLFGSFSGFAQSALNTTGEPPGLFSNPMFLVLLGLIIVLMVFIMVLAEVVKSAGAYTRKIPHHRTGPGIILPRLVLCLTLTPLLSEAQATADSALNYGGLSPLIFWSMAVVIIFELLIISALVVILRKLTGADERKATQVPAVKKSEKPAFEILMDKVNAAVSVEQEKDILLDHHYDGIRELDNRLPPWWVMGFYVTIFWGLIYVVHFHITRTGDLSDAEYRSELVKAKHDIEEYMKTAANLVDETNVKVLSDAADLAKGKDIFKSNCAACHGQLGEGTVGPNLTDDYWIHGGSIQDIFKTVKYGFAEKGMQAWKENLAPMQIALVSSYIKNLRGTRPPNAKEKQGELYLGEQPSVPASDSSNVGMVVPTKAFH